MVVLTDSQPGSPTKTQHAWSSQAATSQAGFQGPRSPMSESAAWSSGAASYVPPPPPPAYVPGPNAPLLPGPRRNDRPNVAKRFCNALVIAVLILIGFSILEDIIESIVYTPSPGGPRKEDGRILSCDKNWSDYYKPTEDGNIVYDYTNAELPGQANTLGYPVFIATKSFTLPINSSLHYLISRGNLASGVVVVQGKEGADSSVIGVKVDVKFSTYSALSSAQVCRLQKPEGGVGIGIYTPSNRVSWGSRLEGQLGFTVTVTLPISRKSLLELNAFDTNLPNFRHKFQGLGDRVQFEHISLQGTNGAIEADALYVSQGTIQTTNGAINGCFNATDSLVLETTNGSIDTDIGITNDDTHKSSNLVMKNSNGRISSRISLLTTHDRRPQPRGGHFSVTTNSTNGRLDVSFPTTPVNSLLNYQGHTSNARADVSLHAAYEGRFAVSTSNSPAEIINDYASDPTGKKRYRTVTMRKNTKNAIEGEVFWGSNQSHDSDAETGRAVIATSNGHALLRLFA